MFNDPDCEASGGWNEFEEDFDSEDGAIEYAKTHPYMQGFHLVDSMKKQIIFIGFKGLDLKKNPNIKWIIERK